MVVYESTTELPPKAAGQITDLLAPDEEFLLAVHEERFLSLFSPYFIVTDRRFIRFRKLWFSESISDTAFSRLSHVEYATAKAGVLGEVELEGSGVDEKYTFMSGDGRALADAIRGQLAQQTQVA